MKRIFRQNSSRRASPLRARTGCIAWPTRVRARERQACARRSRVLHTNALVMAFARSDPGVVQLLVEERFALEVCPTSNFLTGVALGEAPHPLLDLDAAGCIVTIDADDPAIFKTSVTNELAYAAEIAGDDAPLRFTRNAVEASFASDATKASLRERLKACSLER